MFAAGVALVVFTGGILAAGGQMLIGASLSGFAYDIQAAFDPPSDKSKYHTGWLFSLGSGAALSLIGVGGGQLAKIAGTFAASKVAKVAIRMGIKTASDAVIGAGTGASTRMLDNISHDRNFWDGIGTAAAVGASLGVAAGGMSFFEHHFD